MAYQHELDVALKAARAAAKIQLENLHLDKQIEIKDDLSPVTDIDKQCEKIIIDILHNAFPDDGFLAEESGEVAGTSGRTWIIDPLDGTRLYLKKIPTFSVLVALVDHGEPVVGVMDLPLLNEIYYAAQGLGAYCNEKVIRVSTTQKLDQAYGCAYGHIPNLHHDRAQAVLAQMNQWQFSQGFMDAYSYGCIASGKLDLCLNLTDKPWDCAAAACIIKEAGGQYSDIDGNPSIFNGSFVISNGLLHNDAIANLKSDQG